MDPNSPEQEPISAAQDVEQGVTQRKSDEPIVYIEWIAPAYRQTEKSKGWYALMALIILVFVFYGLFFSDSTGWIVSITFLILAGVFYMGELKSAPSLNMKVMENGVKSGERFYSYSQIKSFWILNEENSRHLHLTLKKGTPRHIAIVVPDDMNMTELRDILLLHIPEEEDREESFSEQLIRNLGL
jgi:hypothetical protein